MDRPKADLDELLLTWEARRERGETVDVADLADTPVLQDELRRRVRLLEAFERLRCPALPGEPAAPLPAFEGYETLARLGEGAMGVVYLAEHRELRRRVALKVLKPETLALAGEQRWRLSRRFVREAQTLAQMRHEHVVTLYGARLQGDTPYLEMEYVPGGSLRDRQKELTEAGPDKIIPLMARVAAAVAYAHEKGVVHRDLKPGNILLDTHGKPLVSDFGLVKLLDETAAETAPTVGDLEDTKTHDHRPAEPALTTPGTNPGTRPYMAPEQYDPRFGPVGKPADVWALGVILHELLTGQRPFVGRTEAQLAHSVCYDAPEQPGPGKVPPRLREILRRCLDKDPTRRPTAAAVAEALRNARKPPRRRWPVLVTAACALALALAWGWPAESPEEKYRRDVEPHLHRLRQGETVELLPSGQVPPHIVRADAGGTRLVAAAEGAGVRAESVSSGMIELLPEVPLRRYRIVAEILHAEGYTTATGACGIYFDGNEVRTSRATRHTCSLFHYNDLARLPTPSGPRHTAWLKYACVAMRDALEPGHPFRVFDDIQDSERCRAFFENPARRGSWRRVEIEVSPEESVVHFDPGQGPALPLGPLEWTFVAKAVDRLAARATTDPAVPPDLSELRAEALTQNRLGLFLNHARCDLRRLSIQPME